MDLEASNRLFSFRKMEECSKEQQPPLSGIPPLDFAILIVYYLVSGLDAGFHRHPFYLLFQQIKNPLNRQADFYLSSSVSSLACFFLSSLVKK